MLGAGPVGLDVALACADAGRPVTVYEAGGAVAARARAWGHIINGRREHIVVDHVVGLTGYVGDASLYRQLQVHECYATAAPMSLSAALLGAAGGGDCLVQPAMGADVLRNPEPNFFILGAKSYGRLNTFLLRTGYQQVDQLMGASGSAAAGGPRVATSARGAAR